jgi:hypothetical protein
MGRGRNAHKRIGGAYARCERATGRGSHGEFINRLLIIGILLLSTMPLYAQAQPPNTAKLKADAQKIVSNIRGDKAKTQAYCQINSLGGQDAAPQGPGLLQATDRPLLSTALC